LEQNYPNPFNPTTNINYTVGMTSVVSISVYDMTGKEVAVLLNESKPAGRYSVEFNAANMPSGVYFYKLTVNGSQSIEKKMVLVK